MERLKIGDRVALAESALSIGYIRARSFYTNMYEGKLGTVIRIAGTGKIGVQFDDIVFTRPQGIKSSHDNGCHGAGRERYCWYIPPEHLHRLMSEHEQKYMEIQAVIGNCDDGALKNELIRQFKERTGIQLRSALESISKYDPPSENTNDVLLLL